MTGTSALRRPRRDRRRSRAPTAPGSPTSPSRPASARRRSAASSTAARASPTAPGRRCSPRSTSSATSGRPGCKKRSAGLVGLIVPGAGQPDLPGVRAGDRVRAGPARLHAGALHPDAGRRPRGRLHRRCCSSAASRGSSSSPGCTPTAPPSRRGTSRCASAGCRSCWSTATWTASTRRSSATTTSPRWTSRSATSRPSATGGSGWRSGPRRFTPGGPQDRRLPRGDAPAPRRRRASTRGSSAPCSASRAARRPPSAWSTAGCTAVICGSDLMALGAIRAVRVTGLSVPGDVSVVGYDDSLLIGFTDPPLTTVRQAVAGDGRRGGPRAAGRDQRAAGAAGRVRVPAGARRARLDRLRTRRRRPAPTAELR